MKNALLQIIALLASFKILAQNDEIKIKTTLYINNEPVNGVQYYFIKNDGKAYLLPTENGRIILKDTLTTEGIPLMAIKGKHRIVFPVYYYRESDYIKIYYDNRIFGNKTKKNLGISRWRYLFRKEYYVNIEGFDDIITVFKPEKEYELIK
ncbi:hypothetical protein [Sinomicrobium weinanense]|uniref:Uncharacterized protein n=1 Tax=Sinomicrobium weinanense TaxID=2842200 RepID=A0A926Q1K8_9FLAO|nr:hypothetical protein [Sinomicrobium weinanense]MBC9795832.1 hypothetical protein [Sinomicrobium weinanense]MBU3125352.1 hypothetical protein [Sinomicrobium weinanense]